MQPPRLSQQAIDALRNATVTEDSLTLDDCLDDHDYRTVQHALTLVGGGGVYRPARRAFVFRWDPRPALGLLLASQAAGAVTTVLLPAQRLSVAAGDSNPNVICEVPDGR